MKISYDEAVREHYNRVADTYGSSSACTMADDIIRAKESKAIYQVVESVERLKKSTKLNVVDVGCGNGHTLKILTEQLPKLQYFGVEYNDKLRALAVQQLAGLTNVQVTPGDLRNRDSFHVAPESADILLCQRVIINLMDPKDQRVALDNIISLVKPGGILVFIEAFEEGLANLNLARSQFGFSAIDPAMHNLYLQEGFFNHPLLMPVQLPGVEIQKHLLSTHYYVSRVLDEVMMKTAGRSEFIRNSEFVRFLSGALPDAVGNYSPLEIHISQKKA